MFNFIIIFIIIIFAFLAGTLSYYKAFKVNNRIVYTIEKYEGYNFDSGESNGNPLNSAYEEISAYLASIGYRVADPEEQCPATHNEMDLVTLEVARSHRYCIYVDHDADTNSETNGNKPEYNEYYQFGILTYMNIDLPIIEMIDLPIFTKTNRIYKFCTNVNDPDGSGSKECYWKNEIFK